MTKPQDMQRISRTCIQNPCSYTGTITHSGVLYQLICTVLTIHALPLKITSLLNITPSKGLRHQIVFHHNVVADFSQCLRQSGTLPKKQADFKCLLKKKICRIRQDALCMTVWSCCKSTKQAARLLLQCTSWNQTHRRMCDSAFECECESAFEYRAHEVCK